MEPTNKQGKTLSQFLAEYNPGDYERPSVTVDILLFTVADREEANYRKLPEKTLKILLVKRGDHPCIGQWALPGGFVNMNESPEAAALRELREETGVERAYLEQLHTYGDPGRDPRTRVISVTYLTLADSAKLDIRAGDDADEALWFDASYRPKTCAHTETESGYRLRQTFLLTLSRPGLRLRADVEHTKTAEGNCVVRGIRTVHSEGIAFDHAEIIAAGITRLREKVGSTDMVFSLMPECFTLTQLQQVCEVILDTGLFKANFRRKIAGRVTATDEFRSEAGHRPARLYRFNPRWDEDEGLPKE